MDEALTHIIIKRLDQVETWVLLVLFMVFWTRKEYKEFKTTRKVRYNQSEIKESLKVLKDKYSNTLSRSTSEIIVRLVYSSSYCKLINVFINYSRGRSLNDLKLKLSKEISIINDEHAQMLECFKYNSKLITSYVKDEILNCDLILNDINQIDISNLIEVQENFKTQLSLSLNKTIERL